MEWSVSERAASPCRRHDCHECCLDTRMTLTEADVARLEAAGFENFAQLNAADDFELANRDGACVFLRNGRCGVYDLRPEGCRYYPFIVDLGSGRVVRDVFCPHRDDFALSGTMIRELKRSVEREHAEATSRRRRNHE